MDSKLKIIGEKPEITKDVKKVINYLENIIINKDTLQEINTAELVNNINILLQCVEIYAEYKKPVMRLIDEYNKTLDMLTREKLSKTAYQNYSTRKQILEELLINVRLEDLKIKRKDYWQDYE